MTAMQVGRLGRAGISPHVLPIQGQVTLQAGHEHCALTMPDKTVTHYPGTYAGSREKEDLVGAYDRFGVSVEFTADADDSAGFAHDRDPDSGSYVFSTEKSKVPEAKLFGSTPLYLLEMDRRGITLPERLLLGLWFFQRGLGHIDQDHMTICLGSQFPAEKRKRYYPTVRYRAEHRCVEIGRIASDESKPIASVRWIFRHP